MDFVIPADDKQLRFEECQGNLNGKVKKRRPKNAVR